jgi:hypothetical protein
MRNRLYWVMLPLLIGIVLGFFLRNLISETTPTELSHITVEQTQKDTVATFRQSAHVQKSPPGATDISIDDIRAALEHLKDISDLNKRSSMRNALLRRWAELDGRGAFEYVVSLDEGEIKVQAMATVTGVLVRSDSQFLAEKALSLPNSRSSRELVQTLANNWSQTDAQSALAWAEQLPEGLGKRDALAIIRFQLGQQDPEEVATQINQLPAGDARNTLISNLATQWGTRDPAKAIEWANGLPEAEKTLAMSQLLSAWANQNPLEAGKFVARLPSGEMQSRAAMSVVSSWANQSPDQTAAWVLQFPEGDLREQGIREVVNIWTMNDSEGARDWAKGLAEGATRDAALKSFAESIAYWSPDKAAAVVGLIDDPQKREQSMEVTMRFWAEMDPASARKWLASLNVNEELKVQLQSFLPSVDLTAR